MSRWICVGSNLVHGKNQSSRRLQLCTFHFVSVALRAPVITFFLGFVVLGIDRSRMNLASQKQLAASQLSMKILPIVSTMEKWIRVVGCGADRWENVYAMILICQRLVLCIADKNDDSAILFPPDFDPETGDMYVPSPHSKEVLDSDFIKMISFYTANARTLVSSPSRDVFYVPDGMTIDVDGNLFVSLYGKGKVAKINRL